jgi:hypothetical protein
VPGASHDQGATGIGQFADLHRFHVALGWCDEPTYLETTPQRFVFVFTPTHGSWLNLIENQFSKMARTMLRGIRVASKQELIERILFVSRRFGALCSRTCRLCRHGAFVLGFCMKASCTRSPSHPILWETGRYLHGVRTLVNHALLWRRRPASRRSSKRPPASCSAVVSASPLWASSRRSRLLIAVIVLSTLTCSTAARCATRERSMPASRRPSRIGRSGGKPRICCCGARAGMGRGRDRRGCCRICCACMTPDSPSWPSWAPKAPMVARPRPC